MASMSTRTAPSIPHTMADPLSKLDFSPKDILSQLTWSRSPQLPTTSFVCTAYTYIQLLEALVNETVKSSLRTPFTFANGESGTRNSALMLSSIASFVGSPSCKILAAPSSWGTTESIQLSLSHTPSSSIVPRSSLTFQPTATLTSSPNSQLTSPSQLTPTTNSSPSQHTQRASTNTGETTKVIIGLVVAITVLVLLFTIGLGSCCVIRKRRRRKNEIIVAHQAASEIVDERLKPQMYIGQKVELDDEQRRYEMEAIDTRFELEGANEICEMPAGEREGDPVRQELSGERHSQGLEKPP